MNFSDLTNEMQQTIMDAVHDNLLRLGINVDVKLSSKIIYDGREMISAETSAFNTTPVIYKAITVKGNGFIAPLEKEDVYSLSINLGYDFTYFNGASNGVDIGEINFYIHKESRNVTCLGLTLKR